MVTLRAGFTLVEVIVSLVLFALALLGLAGVAAVAAHSLTAAVAQERAARHAAGLLDSLTFAPAGGSGSTELEGVTYRWEAGSARHADVTVTATLLRGGRPVQLEFRGRRIALPPLPEP